MREILFRGKRLDNGKWVMGFYVHHRNVAHYILDVSYGGYEDIDGGFFVPRWYAVEPSSVVQYTGLTDKNGKKIFDGDVLDCKIGMYERCKVIFNEFCSSFQLECADGFSDFFLCSINHKKMEVIGNIHDNLELLENP